jgi:hypothetical protein
MSRISLTIIIGAPGRGVDVNMVRIEGEGSEDKGL